LRRIRSDYFGIAICFIALIWICIPFVSAAGLSIISPNGGEAWEQGTSHTIEWTYTGNLDSSAWITINGAGTTRQYTTSIGSNGGGSYLWNIPDNFPLGNDYTVTIGAIDYMSGSTRSDTSDGSFTIRQKPGIISITSPNGWESWEAGSRYSIEMDIIQEILVRQYGSLLMEQVQRVNIQRQLEVMVEVHIIGIYQMISDGEVIIESPSKLSITRVVVL